MNFYVSNIQYIIKNPQWLYVVPPSVGGGDDDDIIRSGLTGDMSKGRGEGMETRQEKDMARRSKHSNEWDRIV